MATADGNSDEQVEQDSQRAMLTGVQDQNLLIDGWFASHADSGTPGPHVRVWAPGYVNGAVLRTDQIPELIANLEAVREHIEQLWAERGAAYVASRGEWIDSNDPAVLRQDRISELAFVDKVQAHLVEVAHILQNSQDIHEASATIAGLLEVDRTEVESRLDRVPLFSLTRTATARREELLDKLRQQE